MPVRSNRLATSSRRGLVALLLVGALACGPGKTPELVPDPTVHSALYKSRISREGERDRRFRMLLFAAEPDRLHVEVLSPVGGTVLILDGGGDRVSVAIPRERRAYVGPADRELFERLLGVPVDLPGWISALRRGGTAGPGIEILRTGAPDSLPTRFEAQGESSRLTLELRRIQPVGAAASELGRGVPPEGFEIRPIDELVRGSLPPEMDPGPADP